MDCKKYNNKVGDILKKRKIRKGRVILLLGMFLLTAYLLALSAKLLLNKPKIITQEAYIAGNQIKVTIYDETFNEKETITRGTKIKYIDKLIEEKYYQIENTNNYILKENITKEQQNIILEKEKYVRTNVTIYKDETTSKIQSYAPKGEKLEIIGYDILENGKVNKYKIKYNEIEGYVYEKYLTDTKEEALENYDNGTYNIHAKRTNYYDKNESAGQLDYYPREKGNFENNIMPDEVNAFYLSVNDLNSVDKYIEVAKQTNINAFVVDIKDGQLAYVSDIAKEYSPNEKGYFSKGSYKKAIQKLKDNGFYVIGRICAFKDSAFAKANPEEALSKNGKIYYYGGEYWPSVYSRKVWEYKVELAKEAVELFAFNEIQFDYVRFPESAPSLSNEDLKNKYNETKSQSIQNFLIYATDELHKLNVYVSADVFGEASYTYIPGYGQYWPAISNIVDVISSMPYTDHFGNNDTWTNPYNIMSSWASTANARQKETTSPAIVRTWITAYNTPYWKPVVNCDENYIKQQIKALKDNNLTGGAMTWNAWGISSKLSKYKEIVKAF